MSGRTNPYFWLLIVVVGVCLLLVLAGVLYTPVQAWDEARRGVNALLMVQQDDYLNYYYLDGYDTFNTKPPLYLWLVVGMVKAFDFSLFVLRSVSLLSFALLVICLAYWFNRHYGSRMATFVVLFTFLGRGLAGEHVGFTGDTDMLFVLFTVLAIGSVYDYFYHGKRLTTLLASVTFFGAAFLTKGVALLLVVPGLWVFVYREKRFPRLSRKQWVVLLLYTLLLLGITTAILLTFRSGAEYPDGYASLLEAMLLNDGVGRATDAAFETGYQLDFVPVALDLKFGPFVYVLYAYLVHALYRKLRGGKWPQEVFSKFGQLSICVVISVLSLLFFSVNKHQWYVAPAVPFLGVVTAEIIVHMGKTKPKWLVATALLLILYGGVRIADAQRRGLRAEAELCTVPKLNAGTLQLSTRTPQDVALRILLANEGARVEIWEDLRGEVDVDSVEVCGVEVRLLGREER